MVIDHGFFIILGELNKVIPCNLASIHPISPVLTRALNALFEDHKFNGFGMPKWSPKLNHLAYADDTIIFTSAENYSSNLIMNTLQKYEEISRQLINKGKSSFYMYSNVTNNLVQQVETITGFSRGSFPFVYLGCPITYARKRKADYNNLLKKVKDKLHESKGKLLSPGGKALLITSVLQSIPIHLLFAIKLPKFLIKDIHKIFARFFWSSNEDVKKRPWSAWLNMCYPKHEVGLGFRSIFDVSKALCAELWWRFRTVHSLWLNFMWTKYCKK
ncbi:uncharacterized protein LOC132064045 [Lycium ferocissimum]|uniref:uncharacterized protein LOC132064045 n=1 Tax=Lycium ferocissimum TaxID=112874 RepID=UPI002815CBCB|nr:uncharacterized protein LOC132064045 [Lycium ferocissimum]